MEYRVEALSFGWRRGEAGERVGGEQQEGEEERAEESLDGEGGGAGAVGEVASGGGEAGAGEGEDECPQGEGAFVVAPDGGEFEDPGFCRVGVVGDEGDGEV